LAEANSPPTLRQVIQIARNRGVEIDQPGFGQLHHSDARKRFCRGVDGKQRHRRDRHAILYVGQAVAFRQDKLTVFDDGNLQTRNAQFLHGLLYQLPRRLVGVIYWRCRRARAKKPSRSKGARYKEIFIELHESSLVELASDLSSTTQHGAVQLNGIVGTLRYIVNFLLFPKSTVYEICPRSRPASPPPRQRQ
jgi:hypothetical protein